MKLSERLRLGASYRPQITEAYFGYVDETYCSCAIGALLETYDHEFYPEKYLSPNYKPRYKGDLDTKLNTDYQLNKQVVNPVTKNIDAVSTIIVYLNDAQRWTREAISNWLESIDL